ncbi:MAG: DeoR family transcriptional regulator [Candidatus Portnoybacteria bacterium]|nr:DeoR family transcriptional regulator [Candidatus Portnoybacteria bacterium]
MDVLKRRAFDICLAVYRLTGFFPKNEVLSAQLREASAIIAASLAAGRINDTILKVEEIKVFLAIARGQNWAGLMNFDLLLNAYCLLVEALLISKNSKSGQEEKERSAIQNSEIDIPLSINKKKRGGALVIPGETLRRQKTIVDFFNENGEATVPQLAKILNNVSERTVRSDLAELVSKKVIVKNGIKRGARYFLRK